MSRGQLGTTESLRAKERAKSYGRRVRRRQAHLPTKIFLHDVLAMLCFVNEPWSYIRASCSGLSVGARTRGRGRALAGPRGLGSPWPYLVVRLVSFQLLMECRTSLPPPLQASKPSVKEVLVLHLLRKNILFWQCCACYISSMNRGSRTSEQSCLPNYQPYELLIMNTLNPTHTDRATAHVTVERWRVGYTYTDQKSRLSS